MSSMSVNFLGIENDALVKGLMQRFPGGEGDQNLLYFHYFV